MILPLQHHWADSFADLSTPWQPTGFPDPALVVLNAPLAAELGLDAEALRTEVGVAALLGQGLEGARPVAQAYAGHQFGGYSPLLGDGRAVLLGEIASGTTLRDLHLKGSGPTRYSRGGDGFAALAPMLREYVVSESMHALGIPTTRSLAVVATGAQVRRDTGLQPGAVLARVAASHLRVGSFQLARAAGDSPEARDLLRRLADEAITRHHPGAADSDQPYLALFASVLRAQARLVAQWMHVGFVHGVVNSDNVTISGETIDYGPCAFLEAYDPAAVFSSIDERGRYAYGNQPPIAQWNLARFAEALLPLLGEDEETAVARATEVLETYPSEFNAAWLGGMRAKLGLAGADADDEVLTGLVGDLLGLLARGRVDWTSFWVALAGAAEPSGNGPVLALAGDAAPDVPAWLGRWRALGPDPRAMETVNPVRIPRNHLVEEALASAVGGDLTPFTELVAAVREPFGKRDDLARFAQPAPVAFTEGFRTFCGT